MAFTTPATATATTILNAAYLNTYVRDNIAWLATDSPACRAYNNANLAIANAGLTALTLNSERYDNAAMHSTSSNTSRLTVPTGGGGKYIVGGSWGWAISSSGSYRQGRALINNTTGIALLSLQPSAFHASEGFITSTYSFSAADYFELAVQQDSGGALDIGVAANYSPEAWMFWFRT